MTENNTIKTVAICDTEPIAIAGLRSLLDSHQDLLLVGAENSMPSGLDMVRQLKPAVVIIDKAFGIHAVLDWIPKSALASHNTASVVWGASIHGAEAVRFMQCGASGVMRKSTELDSMLNCLRTVGHGQTWLEQMLLKDSERTPRRPRTNLTQREQEVLALVEQGMKNKDIAMQLGIQPGTVKIHLKHIFEKTGIHGRYGLALNGLKEKGLLAVAAAV